MMGWAWHLFRLKSFLRHWLDVETSANFWALYRKVGRAELQWSGYDAAWNELDRRLRAVENAERMIALWVAKHDLERLEVRSGNPAESA